MMTDEAAMRLALMRIFDKWAEKSHDYAEPSHEFDNYRITAQAFKVQLPWLADLHEFQKILRIANLVGNDLKPDVADESLADTYLDKAVYAVMALAMKLQMEEQT
jgi:hypothetical protein